MNAVDISHRAALDFLRRDPLRHILHLKMLAYYPQRVECVHCVAGSHEGVLLLFPTTALSYDAIHYAHYQWVAMPTATSSHVFERLLDRVPTAGVVFKLLDADDEALVATRFAGKRVRQFLNYSSASTDKFAADPRVVVSAALNPGLTRALCESARHNRADLERFFADGGLALSIEDGGRPISVGMIYRSFEHIWEIAALSTIPSARRQGHAAHLVSCALQTIGRSGYTPRYVVEDTNLASIRLAEKVRLQPFVSVIHFASTPAQRGDGADTAL